MNDQRRSSDSHQKAREALEKLLRLIDEGKLTGEVYLRLNCNQGGIVRARFSVEGE